MTWTQPLCRDCWDTRHPDRLAPREPEMGGVETCCDCGQQTTSGIFVRLDPATVKFPAKDEVNVAVIVATCGHSKWAELAYERAVPSAAAEARSAPGRMMFVQHHPDMTVAQARNRAASHCNRFDWLCFLDADDELEPGYLDAMERELLRVSHGDERVDGPPHPGFPLPPLLLVPKVRRFVYGDPRYVPVEIPNQGKWPETNECVIGTLVERSLFEQVGGFRDETDDGTPIALYEDWDLWLRCYDAGAKLVYTDAVYREHVNPTGRNYSQAPQVVYDAIWRDHLARMNQ